MVVASVGEASGTEGRARPTCLLLMPLTFYSFPKAFCRALEALGYNVVLANDEYPANPLGKALNKLDLAVGRRWTRRVVNRRFLSGRHYNLVVIIKGRGVGPELVADMRRCSDRIVGYHYDSLAYEPASAHWGSEVDRVSTFDYRDAAANGWPVVELFSATRPPDPRPPVRYRVSAILRNHSHRLVFVDRVLSRMGREGALIYLYEKDVLSFAFNALRHPLLYWRWRRQIHFTPMDYEAYAQVLAQSRFTLDYAHPKQTGATMRSIEARSLGIVLITNNTAILDSPTFDRRGVVVWRDGEGDPTVDMALERPAPRPRSPEAFMAEVIGAPPPLERSGGESRCVAPIGAAP